MQITLNEAEILNALDSYVRSKITISDDQSIQFDLKAGRGENGFSATLDIVTAGDTDPAPEPVAERPKSKPITPKPSKPKAVAEPDPKPEEVEVKPDEEEETTASDEEQTEPEEEKAPPKKTGSIFSKAK